MRDAAAELEDLPAQAPQVVQAVDRLVAQGSKPPPAVWWVVLIVASGGVGGGMRCRSGRMLSVLVACGARVFHVWFVL